MIECLVGGLVMDLSYFAECSTCKRGDKPSKCTCGGKGTCYFCSQHTKCVGCGSLICFESKGYTKVHNGHKCLPCFNGDW